MSPNERHPCEKGLTWDCFKRDPAWAKQALAHRLLHILCPGEITRRLPKILATALIAPGVLIPPGVVIPPGTVVYSGTIFPPGWETGQPWPPGVIVTPTYPPSYQPNGTTPPIYVTVWEGGPAHGPTPGAGVTVVAVTTTATNDGRFGGQHSNWDTAHDYTMGNFTPAPETETTFAIEARNTGMLYRILRAFFSFDLPALPAGAVVTSCVLTLHNYGTETCNFTIHEGEQSTSLWEGDYDEFKPGYYALGTWTAGANAITLDAAGITYVQGVMGARANFCMREYDHDYLDVAPGVGEDIMAGLYWSGAAAANRPSLTVTYEI